jgi:hypothetical protein
MLNEQQRIALLRSDRRKINWIAPVVTWIANAVAILWLGLFVFALLKDADEAIAFLFFLGLPVLGLPVLGLWLVGRAMPKVVKFVNEHWA